MNNADRVMLEFEKKVNNSPQMNVKMKWTHSTDKLGNQPDYWLGVAHRAYKQEVITHSEFIDVLLALKASGARSDYFNDVLKNIARGGK